LERWVKTQLTGSSHLRRRGYVLDCGVIEEEFLTLTLDGCEWAALFSGLFTSMGRSPISTEETLERIWTLFKRFLSTEVTKFHGRRAELDIRGTEVFYSYRYIPLRKKGNLNYTRSCFIARTFDTLNVHESVHRDTTMKITNKMRYID
jgi:hypothetical protein